MSAFLLKAEDFAQAQSSHKQYAKVCRRLSIEFVLHSYNLREPSLVNLVTSPEKLIEALFSHPSVLDVDSTSRPGVIVWLSRYLSAVEFHCYWLVLQTSTLLQKRLLPWQTSIWMTKCMVSSVSGSHLMPKLTTLTRCVFVRHLYRYSYC